MIVREAISSDFEKVYPLLYKLNRDTLSKKDWEKLFVNHFQTSENFHGYVLEIEDKIEGYFGTIFSERSINGEKIKFCNTTSWIVNEAYRDKSLLLLMKIQKLKGYVFTNFTPSDVVYPILKKLGYKDLDNSKCLIKSRPVIFSSVKVYTSLFESFLNEEEKGLYFDHAPFNLFAFTFVKGDEYCFVISRIKKYRPGKFPLIKLKLAEIEYVSNVSLFKQYIKEVLFNLALKKGISRFVVYKKHLEPFDLEKNKPYKTFRKYVYKGDIDENCIDTLYSELFVLNI